MSQFTESGKAEHTCPLLNIAVKGPRYAIIPAAINISPEK